MNSEHDNTENSNEERGLWGALSIAGPGIAVAATGVGAGDMVAAAVAGAMYGTVILWAAIYGAAIKFALNEGVARWQLATGTTLLEGWEDRLGRKVTNSFLVFFLLWSFIVAGALMSACGIAAHALFKGPPVWLWGIVHSLVAAALVFYAGYNIFEKVMKFFIGIMFLIMVTCAVMAHPDWLVVLRSSVIPTMPNGSGTMLIGIMGGVGASLTLLNYGYWIREKGWRGKTAVKRTWIDLSTAYIITGLFGAAVMVIAAGVEPEKMKGSAMVLGLADRLGEVVGPTARHVFLIGFWGAVFSSMLGVWQGVPYIFADFIRIRRRNENPEQSREVDETALPYRGFLIFLTIPPMMLLWFQKLIGVIIAYAVVGAAFMPFLAGTLLYMNNRKDWVGDLKYGVKMNAALILALVLFGTICVIKIIEQAEKLGIA